MNFKVFLLIFALPIFLSKYLPIFSDISDISVKSKYRYIRKYRYFVPCSRLNKSGRVLGARGFIKGKSRGSGVGQ